MVVSVVGWGTSAASHSYAQASGEGPWCSQLGSGSQENARPLGLELPLLPDVPMVMQS